MMMMLWLCKMTAIVLHMSLLDGHYNFSNITIPKKIMYKSTLGYFQSKMMP